jgi:Fe-S cluster assembly protein SufD
LGSALADRHQQAARLAETLELPQFKGRPGWEFTDISGLDLETYEAAIDTPLAGTARALFDLSPPPCRPGWSYPRSTRRPSHIPS